MCGIVGIYLKSKKFVKSLYKPTHIDLMNQSRGSNLLWDVSDSYALATVIDKFPGMSVIEKV